MTPINYLSDNGRDYSKALRKCKSLADLREFGMSWVYLASDASAQISVMGLTDWKGFIDGLRSESKGEFAGEEFMEKYGAVLIPELLLKVELFANQHKAPFGLVFIRLKEAGQIIEHKVSSFGMNDVVIAKWKEESK